MAGTILQQRLNERARGGFKVNSAGLGAFEGDKASRFARIALKESGLDLNNHRSSRITPDLVAQADLILTMTGNHCRSLLEQYPQARVKTFTIGEYIGDSRIEVPDPVGGDLDAYRHCRQQLEDLLEQVSMRLLEQFHD